LEKKDYNCKKFINYLSTHTIRLYKKTYFNLLDFLGEGLTSKVYKASKSKNNEKIYALKIINKNKADNEILCSIIREIKILRKLRHCVNVNRLYRIYEDKNNVYMLL